jgi:hypothetical protein
MVRDLLSNVSVNTTGTGVAASGANMKIAIFATSFGSGTVTIEGSPDGGTTWIGLTQQYTNSAATATANAFITCNPIGPQLMVRAKLTGATGASGVYARMSD